jgi:DNA-binding transcriptional regulator YdaS (Cro superfamily)
MSNYLTPFEALKRAVDQAGGQSATARICNVSQTAVWKWLQSGKRLPAEYVIGMERLTGVSRHALRPDIYPVEERESSARWLGVDQGSAQQSAHL